MLYSIEFTWTPTSGLVGSTQTYCTLAMNGNNLQSTEYCLNFAVLGNTTTTTTTEVVTITETASDLPLGLELSLSLALLSLLSLLILGDCCCLKKLRQPCMKQNIVREQTQSSQLDRTSLTDTNEMHANSPGSFQPKYSNNISTLLANGSLDDFSGDFRRQYIK